MGGKMPAEEKKRRQREAARRYREKHRARINAKGRRRLKNLREFHKKRLKKWFIEHPCPCERCQEGGQDIETMQGHHRDPSTKGANLSEMRHASDEDFHAEADKCIGVCASYHAKLTNAQHKAGLIGCKKNFAPLPLFEYLKHPHLVGPEYPGLEGLEWSEIEPILYQICKRRSELDRLMEERQAQADSLYQDTVNLRAMD